jgi:glucokinase
MNQTLLGIEIGGTKLQIVAAQKPTRILRRWRATADRAGGGPAIQRQIEAGLREILAGEQPSAIGVGFGGPVDVAAGRIRCSHQIEGWEGFPLRDWIARISGVPVVVENDSNTATFAEAIHGAGRGFDPVFYCNFGSGVGGGLVVGGGIYHGAPPGEAEFGHLRLDRSGATVESRCSGWAVDRRLRETIIANPGSALARLAGTTEGGEALHLAAAIAAGDSSAAAVLDDVAADIAFALSHVVHLLHPGVIVIGGGLSLVGEPLRAAIETALPANVMEAFHPPPAVRLAALGEESVPVGSLELAARTLKL